MLSKIKKELLESPQKLSNVLEHFEYCNIKISQKYIHFGRDGDGSPTSIYIKLKSNDKLYVVDCPKNICCDLFSYIIKQRNVEFENVLNTVKNVLGIQDYYDYFDKSSVFGGFYDKIKRKEGTNVKTYDLDILDQFIYCGNLRFLKDNISLQAQRYFGIRYDVDSQNIIIPIYDQLGQLMGVKSRVNKEVDTTESKYYYPFPCQMSQTLYGYSHNYKYLVNNTIYIFESEKSVMQCYSYGIRNCVAIGSSSISSKQIVMLLELNPTKIIFMHDEGLLFATIKRNIDMIQTYLRMSEVEIGYWDSSEDIDIPEKASASDLRKEKLLQILNTQIIMTGDERYKEKLQDNE